MVKKLLSAMLVLAMLLAPTLTLAEGATTGYAKITISDLKMTAPGVPEIDLTGLSVNIETAADVTDPANFAGSVQAQLMVNGEEAASGAALLNNTGFTLMLTGLKEKLTANFADLDMTELTPEMLEGALASMSNTGNPADMEKAMEDLVAKVAKIEGEVDFDYRGETVKAEKVTITLTMDDLYAIYGAMGVPTDMMKTLFEQLGMNIDATISVYAIDGTHMYMDGLMTVTATEDGKAETVTETITGDIEISEDGRDVHAVFDMKVDGDENATMKMDVTGTQSDAFADAMDMTMKMDMLDEDGEAMGAMTMTLKPNAVADGYDYDYAMTMTMVDSPESVELSGKAKDAAGDVEITLDAAITGEDAGVFHFAILGKETDENGTKTFDGTISFAVTADDQDVQASFGLKAETSEDITGKIAQDNAEIPALYLPEMTQDEAEALQTEASGIMMGALSKLMQIPGVLALMQAQS